MEDLTTKNNLGFISPRAVIAKSALCAPSVRVYGPAKIGTKVILGPNVIIGHPSPSEQTQLKSHLQSTRLIGSSAYDDIIDSFVIAETVIEEGTVIRSGTIVYSGTRIAKNADIAHACLIRENSRIGRDTLVVTGTQIMAAVVIGHGCRIAGTLCNRTRVGNCASMLGHAMHRYKVGVPGHIEPAPNIGDGATIGREAAIVGDVEIGNFAIVGAGAVVTKSIPANTIWIGNPATQAGVRKLEEYQELVKKVNSYED